MGTRDRRRRRNRRRRLRVILEFLFVTGSFSLLAMFSIYVIKMWEDSKWEQAISDSETAGARNQEENQEKRDGYEAGGYGMDGEESYSVKTGKGKSDNAKSNAEREAFLQDKPAKRTEAEVLARLNVLKESYPEIKAILEEKRDYPDEILAALANNPEMLDFVINYKTKSLQTQSGGKVRAQLTKEEKIQEYPLFLQWDERWGYAYYGDDSNIGLSGCGPTCLSMVLYYKTKDASRTPDVLGDYAMKQGYYVSGTGTAWAFMEEAARHYGLRVKRPTKSEEVLKAELDRGRYIICAMGPGDFTAAGHFIVLYGYDENGFFINDPNSRTRSGQKWSFDEISGQIKSIWVYY